MKVLVIGIMVLGLVGCSSLTSFFEGPVVKDVKAHLESVIGSAAEGTYKVVITKDDVVLYNAMWECTQDKLTGKLSGCHKREIIP